MENAWGASPFTLNFIKKLEGYTPKPKWDHKQYSTGFGTRWEPGQPMGTKADHEAALAREAGAVDEWLDRNVTVPLSENQRAALTSAGFNLGTGAKGLGRLLGDINANAWDSVARRLPSFNKASGQVNQGLVNRRAAEVEMLTGRKPYLAEALQAVGQVPGTTAAAPSGGPMPVSMPAPPSSRRSKLADMLVAKALSSQPRGWGDALNSITAAFVGSQLGSKHDDAEKGYRSSLSQALMGAKDADALTNTLLASGDPDLQKSAIQLKVAQTKPQSQIGRFRPTKQGVVDTTTGQIVPGTEAAGADAAEFGTTPVPYEDKDGNIRYTQMSKAGGRKDVDLPEGAKWLPGIDYKDTGTGFTGVNKKTGRVEGEVIQKNVAGEAAQKAIGKEAGEATVALPAAKSMVENAFKTIGELEKHPGLETGTGLSNVIDPRSWTPGTDAYNFLAKNKQAMGQSFMTARESLKGAGQVTDFEGAKGEQAIANLDAAQSREQYLEALKTLKSMMQASYDDLARKASMGGSAQPAPGPVNSQNDPLGIR